MSKHTKEPWEAISPCDGKCCWHIRPVEFEEYEPFPEINLPEMSEANAKRIVACVNACTGMDDPQAAIAQLKQIQSEFLDAIGSIPESARQCLKAAGYDGLVEWIDRLKTLANTKG